jgi:hypothetical protein
VSADERLEGLLGIVRERRHVYASASDAVAADAAATLSVIEAELVAVLAMLGRDAA